MKQQAAQGAQLTKPPLLRMYMLECLALLLLAALLWLSMGKIAAYSAVIGGLISIAPNSYFARWAFRFSGANAASNIARSFYVGEAGKFILTTLLFAMVFITIKTIDVVVIFLSYIFITALNWILALRLLKR